jgi:hypothetical protein
MKFLQFGKQIFIDSEVLEPFPDGATALRDLHSIDLETLSPGEIVVPVNNRKEHTKVMNSHGPSVSPTPIISIKDAPTFWNWRAVNASVRIDPATKKIVSPFVFGDIKAGVRFKRFQLEERFYNVYTSYEHYGEKVDSRHGFTKIVAVSIPVKNDQFLVQNGHLCMRIAINVNGDLIPISMDLTDPDTWKAKEKKNYNSLIKEEMEKPIAKHLMNSLAPVKITRYGVEIETPDMYLLNEGTAV